ncbi:hypothetical protein [Cellulosimicrobium cellulans]|uniref:hypothetical protein n=1 Tax=Cellulosimicrobium cellulans TaxID=1710 RepID=UPI0024055D61|nr:hypothetical protein [Cellulosimicrobium cellulans]MDF9875626.1 hypothetical protein [Cellulosimicrobium cellulans]
MDSASIAAVGTALAVTGLLAAAPRASGEALAIPVRGLLRLLARVWPGLRRAEVKTARGGSTSTVTVSGRARGDSWNESGSVEERIAHLRAGVLRLQREIDEVHSRIDEATKARLDEIRRVEEELRQELRELDRKLLASEKQTHDIQTRGFPLAATGALVAGVPWLFTNPTGLGFALVAGGYGVWLAWRPITDVCRAWRAFLNADGFFTRRRTVVA